MKNNKLNKRYSISIKNIDKYTMENRELKKKLKEKDLIIEILKEFYVK